MSFKEYVHSIPCLPRFGSSMIDVLHFRSDCRACKITTILFVCNILHVQCSCGQCVSVEGGVTGKTGWICAQGCSQPTLWHNVPLCLSRWWQWFPSTLFWRTAYQVILPHCVSFTKLWLQFACQASSRSEGDLERALPCILSNGENLVGGHSVGLRTCKMWITSELKNCLPVHFSVFLKWVKLRRSRAVGVCKLKSRWPRVKGSLSVGCISWMFWEAAMETGEGKRPIPPSRVLAVTKRSEKVLEREKDCNSAECFLVKTDFPQSSASLLQVCRATGPLTEPELSWDKERIKRRGGADKLLTYIEK